MTLAGTKMGEKEMEVKSMSLTRGWDKDGRGGQGIKTQIWILV